MATDDLTPTDDAGLDDTIAAASKPQPPQETSPKRSPSQQQLHEEVRGRLFEGREPRRSLEPGTMVAGRYRIAELLGSGGMGEVFRARDLVLGEDVAVKFLPEDRANDEGFMQRFVNEVRLARQISHPSVCRVHDIGEVDGRAFLSMEYIDGEDLASLLRRIGRLPPEKAYELAQQLCAGLSELHDAGLLHRDLKPANLMIDGQGRLKLADFGLAAIRDELHVHEFGDGTPAYMAPEQLGGREVSQRSDIYALGVVLYELLCGRHPYEARESGLSGERGSIDRTVPAVSLGARVTGLEADTLEIIERCLEADPSMRPASVLDVAAALPGGDPIAAALRAGRAPSVDALVSVESGTLLKPWAAWSLAVFSMLVVLVFAVLSPEHTMWGVASPKLAPAVLEDRARASLAQLGVESPEGSSMHRIVYEDSYLRAPIPRVQPRSRGLVPILFEYRASPGQLARRGPSVTHDDPAMLTPGEVRVTLDVRGNLRAFERIPDGPAGGKAESVDWSSAFELAGLSEVEPVAPEGMPRHVHDLRQAWMARPLGFDRAIRVDAGSWRGRPVWFEVSAPWSVEEVAPSPGAAASSNVKKALLSLFLVGVVLLARRLYRRGEIDTRGAIL
ncbi:MAG: serine/threonine protein kinase, partial [Nannocystaceae bacterium]|nr:serine/threonine protein kinase [Nannocystaceae bacterium]